MGAFSNIKHFFGKVLLAVVSIVHKTDVEVDQVEPEIAKLLEEGTSVSQFIPGIGPEVTSILNAGVQLLGDAKASIDATDAVLATAEQQAQVMAPEGYTFIAIKTDVKADIATLLTTFEAEYQAAKTTVSALSPPATPTVAAAAVKA